MIYTAAPIPANAQNHPLFIQKGIKDRTHAPLSSLKIVGVPWKRQLCYDGYRANIDIFVSATNQAKKLSCLLEGAHLPNTTRDMLDIPYPKIAFMPAAKLSADQLDQLSDLMRDSNPELEKSGKSTKIILHNPTKAMAQRTVQMANEVHKSNPDEIHPSHVFVFEHLIRVLSEFLRTNSYPADTNPDLDDINFEEEDHPLYNTVDLEASMTVEISRHNLRMAHKDAAITVRDESDNQKTQEMVDITDKSNTELAMSELVLNAKPSPMPLDYNSGTCASAPIQDGIVFPYFDGMILGDRSTLRRIFFQYFFRTMGVDRGQCHQRVKEYQTAIESISLTPVGMMLSHLYFGIDLALQTQTRMFVILESSYMGFVLYGRNFSVFDGVRMIASNPAEDVAHDIASLSSHTAALFEVCRILAQLKVKDTGENSNMDTEIDSRSIKTSQALIREILRREPVELTDDFGAFKSAMMHIQFGKTYRSITHENIVWAIEQMTFLETEPLGEMENVYIPPGLGNIQDKVFRVLCCFGPESFSFINSSSKAITFLLPAAVADRQDGLSFNPDVFTHELRIARKGVTVCYKDWKEVVTGRYVKGDPVERAAKSRLYVLSGDRKNVVIDALVKGLPSAADHIRVAKKKRGTDDEGNGPDKKVPKTASDIFALFPTVPEL